MGISMPHDHIIEHKSLAYQVMLSFPHSPKNSLECTSLFSLETIQL